MLARLPTCARALLIVLAPVLGVACGRDASSEARMFLDRYDQLDIDDPVDDRRRRVASLESMPLSHDEVRRARDVCVDAHRALIEAEDLHARARAAFGRYEDESQIPAAQKARIRRDISGSNRALGRARELVARCERHKRDLELRYRRRRR